MIIFNKNRKAFSMITAIFVILLMATVGGFILNLSGKMVQETTTQYRKEQAILYAKSYTEYAIMAATAQTCIRNITSDIDGTQAQTKKGQGYHVEVKIQYLGTSALCTNYIGTAINRPTAIDNIILVDTYVHYREPEHPDAMSGAAWGTPTLNYKPGITYHRRTLQRL